MVYESSRWKADRRFAGFTLFELAVVVLLAAILGAWGLSLGHGLLEAYELESAKTSFVSHLAEARNLSVSRNLPVSVRVHNDSRRFSAVLRGVTEVRFWVSLPGRVRFSASPGRDVTFYSRGTAAPAGSFVLNNSWGSIRVVVALSGRIRWEREP